MRGHPLTLPSPGGTPLHLEVWRSITAWDWLRVAEARAEHFSTGGHLSPALSDALDILLDKLLLELKDQHPGGFPDHSLRDGLRRDLLLKPRYDPLWVTGAFLLMHDFGVPADALRAAAQDLIATGETLDPEALCTRLDAARTQDQSSPLFNNNRLMPGEPWAPVALRATIGLAEAIEPGATRDLSARLQLLSAGSWVLVKVGSIDGRN